LYDEQEEIDLENAVKMTMIAGMIEMSGAEPETKDQLIGYVTSHDDAAMEAAFRLGQMDMRESAAAALTDAAAPTKGVVHGTMMAAVEIVNNLKTI